MEHQLIDLVIIKGSFVGELLLKMGDLVSTLLHFLQLLAHAVYFLLLLGSYLHLMGEFTTQLLHFAHQHILLHIDLNDKRPAYFSFLLARSQLIVKPSNSFL